MAFYVEEWGIMMVLRNRTDTNCMRPVLGILAAEDRCFFILSLHELG